MGATARARAPGPRSRAGSALGPAQVRRRSLPRPGSRGLRSPSADPSLPPPVIPDPFSPPPPVIPDPFSPPPSLPLIPAPPPLCPLVLHLPFLLVLLFLRSPGSGPQGTLLPSLLGSAVLSEPCLFRVPRGRACGPGSSSCCCPRSCSCWPWPPSPPPLPRPATSRAQSARTSWISSTSEIRLVEIIESLCESDAFECNNMVENQEEHLENWWFKQKKRHPDLFRWFCVDTLRVCCLSGTYGPDCLECPGGAEQPCRGNGYCNGDGSRGGDGKCACHLDYTGALCMDCVDGYFSSWRNDTHSVCTVCHQACKTCTGPSPKDCGECELGWPQQEDACVDVDECAAEAPACEEGFYCLNNNGSFSCQACDASCAGCVGEGPEHCKSCTAGYAQEAGACRDIDECAQPEEACPQEHQKCFNTPGSFVCACAQGFQETDGACVPTPETQEEPQEAGPASSSHEDL